jgi:hypothetical protein
VFTNTGSDARLLRTITCRKPRSENMTTPTDTTVAMDMTPKDSGREQAA